MEEALHDLPLFREVAHLSWDARLPDESTILRFRHLLERHKLVEQILATVNDLLRYKGLLLKAGTVVDATLIAASSSTKSATGERDPEIHQTKKCNQWYFGMKAHIGVDAESGLVHTVRGTPANVNDVVEGNSLLHSSITAAFLSSGKCCTFGALPHRVTLVVASVEPRILGAAMKEISGEIWTDIQEPCGCSVAGA